KWFGRCGGCQEWNTLVEQKGVTISKTALKRVAREEPQAITDVEHARIERFVIGIPELDRVLGGGLVRGGITLIGGEPLTLICLQTQRHKLLSIF
ncbi:MAG: hypothetical protein ACREGC_01935, partial [Minisyncoccia bacterium]